MHTLTYLFDWLLTASLRASVLTLGVVLIQMALQKHLSPRWRYALWLPVLAVLLTQRYRALTRARALLRYGWAGAGLLFAAMAGAVLNALNIRLDPPAIAFQLEHGGAKIILVDPEFSAVVAEALKLMRGPKPMVIDVDDKMVPGSHRIGELEYEYAVASGDPTYPGVRPEDEWDAISLGYTSGSGASKTTFTENDDPKRLIDLDNALHQANELFVTGRPADAIRQFEAVIAKRPDLVDAYRYMAYAYWQLGQPVAAIKTLEAAVTLHVADQDVLTRLGVFLAETGQAAKAIALLESVKDQIGRASCRERG